MQAEITPAWLGRLHQAIRRDPKKATIMAVLAVVLLGLWGRLLFGGPRRAAASLVRVLSSDNHALAAQGPHYRTADEAMMDWLNEKEQPIERDLFAVNLDYYPREGRRLGENAGFSGDEEKSAIARTDHKRERQILIENLQAQAANLKLQSTVMSVPPRAIINGELVEEGNAVASFRVLKIEPRRIIVEQQGVRLEIGME